MDDDRAQILAKIANTIRQLSFEAVEKAHSGHPGLPMGCAELGAYLYGQELVHYPKQPRWSRRDRMILSAGHGSAWLYSCLHLAGFDLTLNDLQHFRRLDSKTPGHPEYGLTCGVEATTGPLGQGIGNAVGQALGLKILADKFPSHPATFADAQVICLAGDGCLMEGVSHEVSSLAGHLGLDNLILIHDSNQITLDGPLEQSSSEDVAMRYRAYGFHTLQIDGHDFASIETGLQGARLQRDRPTFITCRTIIGKGAPSKAGSYKAHGSPLGPAEVRATKEALGLPDEEFYIPHAVRQFFQTRVDDQGKAFKSWQEKEKLWQEEHPKQARLFEQMRNKSLPADLCQAIGEVKSSEPLSGRKASQALLKILGEQLPFLYGGSADLSSSDCTWMNQYPPISPHHFEGRNLKYGVREFGMATIAAGLFLTDLILPFVGTFLTFSDYMRNAIRLAALSDYQVIFQMTHDSVFLGEDGPTHQSVEQIASLRAMPGVFLFRPADLNEVKGCWLAMLERKGPSVIALSRQNLPQLKETDRPFAQGVLRGAYIVKEEDRLPDFTLFATGSELSLALDVASALQQCNKDVRVISIPCWELFESQESPYRDQIIGGQLGHRVAIEAGSSFGWERYVGTDGTMITVDRFGCSGSIGEITDAFGFTVDAILGRLLSL